MFNKLEVELTAIYPPSNDLRKMAYEIAVKGYEYEQANNSENCDKASYNNVANLLEFYFRYLDEDSKRAATRYKKVKDKQGLATILLEGVTHWNEDDIDAFFRYNRGISDRNVIHKLVSQLSAWSINTFWDMDAERDELQLAIVLLNVAGVYRLAGYNVILNLPHKKFTMYAHDID
jgi:hypothetical protein